MFKINNRRYIGSKTKLIPFIKESLEKSNVVFNEIADIFAGTGIVAYELAKKKVIVNDILVSNKYVYNAFFGNEKYCIKKLETFIKCHSNLEYKENYFSKNFGNKYFSNINASKIGQIRESIKKVKLNSREKSILITSLMYSMDKVANTVGHYEAFLNKKQLTDKKIKMVLPDISKSFDAQIFAEDANSLVKKIKFDLVYIDPPYNSRQYVNFYHVWENVAEWNSPKLYGKTLKFKEKETRMSNYSKAKASQEFENLINDIQAKTIVVSYNNTTNARSGASNIKIPYEKMLKILKSKGKVDVYKQGYQYFNSGKTNLKNHQEIIFICKVNQKPL